MCHKLSQREIEEAYNDEEECLEGPLSDFEKDEISGIEDWVGYTDTSRRIKQEYYDPNYYHDLDWDPRFTPDGRAVLFASSNAGAPPFMYFVCPFGEFTR